MVGVNIGKNADTPLSGAVDDYVECLRAVRSIADYIAVNVSSPNTSGLRALQGVEHLEPLLRALLEERDRGAMTDGNRPPLLVKLSPDLEAEQLGEIVALFKTLPIDGVIATNTTIKRDSDRAVARIHQGGLSGAPLRSIALGFVRELRDSLGAVFPIIGVGGVDSPVAARAMRDAGADLVQLYTGLVYRGPSLVRNCIRAIG